MSADRLPSPRIWPSFHVLRIGRVDLLGPEMGGQFASVKIGRVDSLVSETGGSIHRRENWEGLLIGIRKERDYSQA